MCSSQHRAHILAPSVHRAGLVATRQQLQLQSAALVQELGRGRHFGGHFQAQQGSLCSSLWGRCGLHRLRPSCAGGGIDAFAQLLRRRQSLGLTGFPSVHQVAQRLTMGL